MHKLQLAKFTSRLARDVYHPCKLMSNLGRLGWKVQNFQNKNAQYSVITKTNRMKMAGGENVGEPKTKTVVIFCGTNDRRDWKDNCTLSHVEFGRNLLLPNSKVHEGFHRHYMGKIQKCLLQLPEIKNSDELFVCGHSLGGAVATMAAFDLDNIVHKDSGKTNLVKNVSTFGAPRTGNEEFATNYNQKFWGRSWRFHNNWDAVPELVPPKWYKHVDQLLYLDGNGNIHPEEKTDLWFRPSELKTDHGADKYVEELSNAIPGGVIDPFGEEVAPFE